MNTMSYPEGGPGGSHPDVGTGRGVPPALSEPLKVVYLPEIVELSLRAPGGVSPYIRVSQVTD